MLPGRIRILIPRLHTMMRWNSSPSCTWKRMLSLAGLNAEQRKQVEKQLLDFKVKCLKEEQAAHAKAKEAEQKKTEAQTKKEQQQYQERINTYKQYGSELGSAVGNLISGQENAMQGFADTMIDIIFDVLGQLH